MNETILAEYEVTADGHKLNVKFLGSKDAPAIRVAFNGAPFFDGPGEVLLTATASLHALFDKLSEVSNDARRTDGQAPTGATGSGPSSV